MVSTRLSSLDIPLTDETRRKLLDTGISEAVIRDLSEMGGQSLLVLRSKDENGKADKPVCFRRRYDPTSALCQGCIISVSCWRGDRRYLERLKGGHSDPPPGVPDSVVADRIKAVTSRAIAPPPPKKKGKGRGRKKRATGRRTR